MTGEKIHGRISRFCEEVLFSPAHTIFGIQAVFLSHDVHDQGVVIHIAGDSHYSDLEKLASAYFRPFKQTIIVGQKNPMATASVNVGGGIRHPNVFGWGTLGGIFTRKNDNHIYGLSNNHVLANLNTAQVGDAILYASDLRIGGLFNWFTLKSPPAINYIDAALVQINPQHLAKWNPPRPVSGQWREAQENMRVIKNGFATGETEGVIISIGGSGKVTVGGQTLNFSDIIEIEGINGPFSSDGDSGSIVLSHPHRFMVGIIFAKHGSRSWALRISRIKNLLG